MIEAPKIGGLSDPFKFFSVWATLIHLGLIDYEKEDCFGRRTFWNHISICYSKSNAGLGQHSLYMLELLDFRITNLLFFLCCLSSSPIARPSYLCSVLKPQPGRGGPATCRTSALTARIFSLFLTSGVLIQSLSREKEHNGTCHLCSSEHRSPL